jgi:hypothetical protein
MREAVTFRRLVEIEFQQVGIYFTQVTLGSPL